MIRYTPFHHLPSHTRKQLIYDPMALQRKHDTEVSDFRLLTGADTWKPKITQKEVL